MTIPEPGLVGKEPFEEAYIATRSRGIPKDAITIGVVSAALAAGFGLGAVSGAGQSPAPVASAAIVPTAQVAAIVEATPQTAPVAKKKTAAKAPVGHTSGTYVASKNGEKYYLPTCATANRIKPENRIWFISKEEAAAAGYTPSSTCKGL